VRDLVNTPAEDMGPAELEAEAEKLAKAHGAKLSVTKGETLEREYPMVHAVGRAAARSHAAAHAPPDLGRREGSRRRVVGKGVCFDSGGLDIKPAFGHAADEEGHGRRGARAGARRLVMGAGSRCGCTCWCPRSRTRSPATPSAPATCCGAARGYGRDRQHRRRGPAGARRRAGRGERGEARADPRLRHADRRGARRGSGPTCPALFARRDETAEALLAAGKAHDDPCWRLPLHEPYAEWLKSDVADTNNAHTNAFAGSSVAALFLDKFVGEGIDWAHFDTFAWRPTAKPGRPKGGDALGLRAAWHMLRERFG
jgi:leucyl aminopeptidase